MRCLFVVVLLQVGQVGQVEHARAESYDLAGLLIQSDAVVVAERIGPIAGTPWMSKYRVTQVLRGAAPTEVEVNEGHYHLERARADPSRVIFLRRTTAGFALVPSGIRAVIAGELHRFAGATGMYATTQGTDPETHWRSDAPRMQLAQLPDAIEAAARRIDAIARAATIADPVTRRAAMVAVFPPPGPGHVEPKYVDLLNERACELLFRAHDLEGALAVAERDRTPEGRPAVIPLEKLYAYAADRTRPVALRVTALRKLSLPWERPKLHALATLVEDAQPLVRRAAIDALVRSIRVSTSEADVAFVRDTLVARYAREDDNDILFDIAEVMYQRKLATLAYHPRNVATRLAGSHAQVACLGTQFSKAELRAVALRGGREVVLPERPLLMQDCGVTHVETTATLPATPGVYALVLTLSRGASAVTVTLGYARMSSNGRVVREP